MRRYLRRLLALSAALTVGLSGRQTSGAETALGKQLLVHYMPWYESKAFSGHWGWHWTMGRYQPERRLADGRREVASHEYPLIEPYDSGDPAVLECQVLLMKFAGIHGVIVDWYGPAEFHDYAAIHRHTLALVPFLKKAGLRLAICYEDQSVTQRIKGGALSESGAVPAGKEALGWLQAHWFQDDCYLRMDGRPVLLVFGPQAFKREQWQELRGVMTDRPLIFGLPHLSRERGMDGAFVWPPVTGGKTLSPSQWQAELERVYVRAAAGEAVVAGAFPSFHDIYQQAGVGESYGRIEDRDGKTLEESLDLALRSSARLIQIATWNDYGEGTVVEPTLDGGFHRLEIIQARAHQLAPDRDAFTAEDLRLPVTLYQLRQLCAGDAASTSKLDRAAELLFASDPQRARALLEEVKSTPKQARQPGKTEESTSKKP